MQFQSISEDNVPSLRSASVSTISLFAFSLFCASILLPRVVVDRVAIGLDDILSGISFLFIISVISRLGGLRNIFFLLWVSIITSGIIFGFLSSMLYLDMPNLSTEIWQYVKRMVFFTLALQIAFFSKISAKHAYYIVFTVLATASIIGLLQYFPNVFSETLIHTYGRTDSQIQSSTYELINARNFGIAGFSTSWGGFSLFTAAFAAASTIGFASVAKVGWFHRISPWVLFITAIVNIFLSGSRAALLSLILLVLCYLIAGVLTVENKKGFVFNGTLLLGAATTTLLAFFWEKLLFIAYRFDVLKEHGGGVRADQVADAIALLDSAYSWVFGVGNAYQRAMVPYTEVEPVLLLVNYGIFGLALRYGLLVLLLIVAFRVATRLKGYEQVMAAATVLGVIGYISFSFGYYFFQELYVGVMPWMVFGWVAGKYLLLRQASSNGADSPKEGLSPI